jgi:hypothetical protein
MRPTIDIADRMKDNVLASMNASKAYLPASVGVPPLVCSSSLYPPGRAKVAPNVTVAIRTAPIHSVCVDSFMFFNSSL